MKYKYICVFCGKTHYKESKNKIDNFIKCSCGNLTIPYFIVEKNK
jgi:DNA-directed RNA polymerase subunit RPC12/RpoP